MSFQTALSGLNAAQANLNVTGNNISNSSTTGFKGSRAEFADLFATSFSGTGSTTIGSGVRLAAVAQQFDQGSIEFTQNNLDLAINGEGFFELQDDDGSSLYSRSGAFSIDRDGYVVNSNGQKLMSYGVDSNGLVTSFTPTALQLTTGTNPANATTTADVNLNLDAGASVISPMSPSVTSGTTSMDTFDVTSGTVSSSMIPSGTPVTLSLSALPATTLANWSVAGGDGGWSVSNFDSSTNTVTLDNGSTSVDIGLSGSPAASDAWSISYQGIDPSDSSTYNFSTSTTVYDSLGVTHTATLYFRKQTDNTWDSSMVVDGDTSQTTTGNTITFNADGSLSTTSSAAMPLSYGSYDPGNGANTIAMTFDLTGSTQYSGDSTVNSLTQDGYATGRLSGIDISSSGVVSARYTNGQSSLLGAVAMANFQNPQGLTQMGDTNWAASYESGDVLRGQAAAGSFGSIQSGALEASNVDLSKQLVNMIIAQRDYQANAKMISTENQVTQSILQI